MLRIAIVRQCTKIIRWALLKVTQLSLKLSLLLGKIAENTNNSLINFFSM